MDVLAQRKTGSAAGRAAATCSATWQSSHGKPRRGDGYATGRSKRPGSCATAGRTARRGAAGAGICLSRCAHSSHAVIVLCSTRRNAMRICCLHSLHMFDTIAFHAICHLCNPPKATQIRSCVAEASCCRLGVLCGEDAWQSSAATYVSCALASGAHLSNSPGMRHR